MTITKQQAVEMFGGKLKTLAAALGLTSSAVSQWPEDLRPDQSDRVIGAAVRLGLIRTWTIERPSEIGSPPESAQDAAA